MDSPVKDIVRILSILRGLVNDGHRRSCGFVFFKQFR